jgi:predicted RNA-binding protein with PUA-like domain
VVAGQRRPDARVDADEEDADAGADTVAQRWQLLYNRHVANWLVKEEPEHYNYDALVRDGHTVWAGVKNPLAQKHLRSIRKGDRIFYYHTGKEKAVVAIARAASDAYADPKDASGKLAVVDVVPEKKLARPVTLAEIKADAAFASFPLVRMSRLSVMPVSDAEWKRIEKMSHA